jgi:deoxyribodipyrimidine photolyase-related protein
MLPVEGMNTMSYFKQELVRRQVRPENRRWLFVPYDQLTDKIGPLSREDPKGLGIVLVENPWKAARRPYHKQKLALILANLRHFALEQAQRGVAVKHLVAEGPYATALDSLVAKLGPLRVMVPAERELRLDLQRLVGQGSIEFIPHEGWLSTTNQFRQSDLKGPPWKMDTFYRFVRRATGILMDGEKPVGEKYSFDTENRLPWHGRPAAPNPQSFPRDAIKEEVAELIKNVFAHHPGRLDLDALPATLQDAENVWSRAKEECLPFFGPFEDAMSRSASGLFHTRVSCLLNIQRLLPFRLTSEVAESKISLGSKEGFIRQVLGWREFVRHIHKATDGFRRLPRLKTPVNKTPGDGGYERWAGRPWKTGKTTKEMDGGASPSALGSASPLPPAYWGERSGLACLDTVVSDVWSEGYSHHITRLMILSNLATLLDVQPRELTDWFWVAYTDAYDWVVEPNVLGMGTYGLGGLMTTKPYVSGAAYINRMSDYCSHCAFNPKTDCPVTSLYWAFLTRHEAVLKTNPRLSMPMASLRKRGMNQKKQDQAIYGKVSDILQKGNQVTPQALS